MPALREGMDWAPAPAEGYGRYGRGKRQSGNNPDFKTKEDFGITKDESEDWQHLADITPDNFEHAMNEALETADHVGALTVVEIAKQRL